jgi:hypothetical protein
MCDVDVEAQAQAQVSTDYFRLHVCLPLPKLFWLEIGGDAQLVAQYSSSVSQQIRGPASMLGRCTGTHTQDAIHAVLAPGILSPSSSGPVPVQLVGMM